MRVQSMFNPLLYIWLLSVGKDFAMKVIKKKQTLKTSEPHHSIRERRILASIDFPFIVGYESHFQTRTELCLVMEYVEGSDLYQLHRTEECFDQEAVRFYLSEILLSLEYLHHLDLIYRDLKLENILIDKTGHVKLVDLGFTRVLTEGEKCKTFCGTADYQAPEILQGKKYNKAVDWWAFGIMAYEVSFSPKISFNLPSSFVLKSNFLLVASWLHPLHLLSRRPEFEGEGDL